MTIESDPKWVSVAGKPGLQRNTRTLQWRSVPLGEPPVVQPPLFDAEQRQRESVERLERALNEAVR